ncbi:MAG TPA: VTT domain-containing protein [Vicinamibacterales bacterium]
MKTFIAWVQGFAAAIGGPGLFIIAFLDSSFVSLPQINDLLVITMVIQRPELMPYYALMATAGSVAGCLVLYVVARRGGDALLRRRFKGGRVERATDMIRRHGVLALVVPALLPPPSPFKLFVLLAGASGMRVVPFALSIAAARGARYLAIGLLSVWYGRQAVAYLEAHGRTVALWVVGIIVAGVAIWLFLRSRRRGDAALTSTG